MQPEQTPVPIDYLDQISVEQKKAGLSSKAFFFILGGALALIILLVIVILSAGPRTPASLQTLGLRLQTTQEIVDDSQKNIKSGELSSINSNLFIYLTNANRDIAEPLIKNNINLKKVSKTDLAKESGADLSARLDNARLNATFDRVYAREMAYQLETISVLMGKSYNSTRSSSLKKFLETSNKDLQVLKKQFADFNPSTE